MTDPAFARTVPVWDPLIRVGHWLLVLGVAVAWITEGEPLWLHSWVGYLVAGIVVARVVWGVVGPQRARFADFVQSPRAALADLAGLLSGRSPRHLGHGPAGGIMVLALLTALAGTALSGMATLAAEEGQGPLAGLVARMPVPAAETLGAAITVGEAAEEEDGGAQGTPEGEGDVERESVFAEIHEVFANLVLGLVLLHVLGVLLASAVHRENLIAAMINGRKRPIEE